MEIPIPCTLSESLCKLFLPLSFDSFAYGIISLPFWIFHRTIMQVCTWVVSLVFFIISFSFLLWFVYIDILVGTRRPLLKHMENSQIVILSANHSEKLFCPYAAKVFHSKPYKFAILVHGIMREAVFFQPGLVLSPCRPGVKWVA